MLEKLTIAFFSQKHESKKEMTLAFDLYNKKWTRFARKNKADEKLFENTVKLVLTKTAETNAKSN